MIVLAPGRLSITIGWPRYSDNFAVKARETRSVPPPGGYGTIQRIGLLGQVFACARILVGASAQSVRMKTAVQRGNLIVPPRGFRILRQCSDKSSVARAARAPINHQQL